MAWNHRVLAFERHGVVMLQIHEVYYDDELNNPSGYSENAVSIEGLYLKDLVWTAIKIRKCLKKPILWGGDKFPEEYIE